MNNPTCSTENLGMYSFNPETYKGSSFKEVKDQIWNDPYDKLPNYVITIETFYKKLKNILFDETQRALNDPHDVSPHPIQKLVHPNGVALSGKWKITEDNNYSGFFCPGTEALIIVRCSVLLYKTLQGSYRGFAFAGKLFPTTDPLRKVETTDFFTIDVLAGTKARYYTDVALTNEAPLGFNFDILKLFSVVIATFGTFINANYNPLFRPITNLATPLIPGGKKNNSPHWLQIQANKNTEKVEKADFRDELMVENYKDNLLNFDISVAPNGKKRNWGRIGTITLDDSVASYSCDHRLIFQHPKVTKWK